MDVMPLVPETKIVDAHKQLVLGTHWQGESCGFVADFFLTVRLIV